jgi:hypothetical protein
MSRREENLPQKSEEPRKEGDHACHEEKRHEQGRVEAKKSR